MTVALEEIRSARAEVDAAIARTERGITLAEEAHELSASLSAYVRAAWHVVEPETPYVHGWHIDAICEALEAVTAGEIRRLQIWVPPGTMKSRTVSVFWPTWEWTRRPSLRYITGSYDLDLATDFAVLSRDLIRSAWYQERFGDRFQLKSDANLKRHYRNDRGGHRYATSPGGGGTGRHADRILIDDPIDAKAADATSETKLEEAIGWHDGTLATRHADPRTGVEVLIMQRLHERDLAGHLLERGYEILCLPERYERAHPHRSRRDERTVDGELLWPARIGEPENAERAASLGAHRAAGQLQQRPAAREGEILKRANWRYYPKAWLEDDGVRHLPAFRRVVISADTSFKEKTTSDFVAVGVWGVDGGRRYLLRTRHGRMGLSAAKDAIRDCRGWALTHWPRAAVTTLVENRANGPEIIDQLRREIPGVLPDNPSVDKTLRAEACDPDFESYAVLIAGEPNAAGTDYEPGETPDWAQAVIEECAAFPNAAHDDLVDMVTMALNWIRARGGPARGASSAHASIGPAPGLTNEARRAGLPTVTGNQPRRNGRPQGKPTQVRIGL